MHACLGHAFGRECFGATATEHGCRLITAASLHCHEMFILLRERCHHIFQTDFGNPDVDKTQVNARAFTLPMCFFSFVVKAVTLGRNFLV